MFEDLDFSENKETRSNDYNLKVVYIVRVGEDTEGKKMFHFLCAKDIEDVWCEEWGEKPACNCRHLQPEEKDYDDVLELKSDIDFILGQENCCCSYQDVCDGCVAMAYENIDGYEEYPSLRLVFHYGDTLDDISEQLAKRDLTLHYIGFKK